MSNYKDLLSTFNLVTSVQKKMEKQESASKSSHTRENINGVIFTDTVILSNKFSINREYVIYKLNTYIDSCKRFGINYMLCDMAEPDNARHLINGRVWNNYHNALTSFLAKNGVPAIYSTGVFIIGGNDVIAVPQEEGYIDSMYNIDIDLKYCFPQDIDIKEYVSTDGINDYRTAERIEEGLLNLAICNVSRLPLTEGKQESITFDNSIGNYLDRVISQEMEIDVKYGMMTTAAEFKNDALLIAENLPLLPLDSYLYPEYAHRGMYCAPHINIEKVYDDPSMSSYIETLGRVDFLTFILHGGTCKISPGYSGDYGKCTAFIPSLLKASKAQILNTVACYGARYRARYVQSGNTREFVEYDVETSMLLSAIYGTFLSFMGASDTAYGGVRGLIPLFANMLIKTYTEQILQGEESFGESLLRSKIRYIINSKDDEIKLSLYTIEEFNLYGDPMIKCKSNGRKQINKTICDVPTVKFPTQNKMSLDKLYKKVRNLVDEGLEDILKKLENILMTEYQIKEAVLEDVEGIYVSNDHVGYKFSFKYSQNNNGYIRIQTNKQGTPTSVYYTL